MLLGIVLGALFLTMQPAGAQTPPRDGCTKVGMGGDREYTCNVTYVENGTGSVYNLGPIDRDQTQVVKVWELVTDVNDPAGLTGFASYDRFMIDRKTGVLSFRSPPDYENPQAGVAATASLAERNVYKVKVKVGDGEKYRPAEITVQVAGEEETETLTLSARQPQVGLGLMATLSGGDILGLRTPDWQWQVEDGNGGWENIDRAVNATYEPKAAEVGKKLRAHVSYVDSHGPEATCTTKSSGNAQLDAKCTELLPEGTGITEFPVRAAPAANVDPVFREDENIGDDGDATVKTASRRIEENLARTPVGPPMFATDNDHESRREGGGPRDVLTYSLGTTLDEARFSIDQITGQIWTKGALNEESFIDADDDRNTVAAGIQLRVTAIATDPSGATGQITVDIHVLDMAEVPEVRGPAALTYFENQPTDLSPPEDQLRLFRDPTRAAREGTDPYVPTPTDREATNQAIFMAFDNDLTDGIDIGTAASTAGSIQWQLTGPDASKFRFGTSSVTYTPSSAVQTTTPFAASSPELRWRSAPDLEAEADLGGTPGDNVFEITVVAWDSDWEIGRRDVTIRLANSNDAGKITLSHTQPQIGTKLTAEVTDQDEVRAGRHLLAMVPGRLRDRSIAYGSVLVYYPDGRLFHTWRNLGHLHPGRQRHQR